MATAHESKPTPAERKAPGSVLEEHFTVQELAKAWKLSEFTVIRMVKGEPGVLKINERVAGRLLNKRPRAARVSLRIPASVAQRIHDSRCA
jgi:hypothetical protein